MVRSSSQFAQYVGISLGDLKQPPDWTAGLIPSLFPGSQGFQIDTQHGGKHFLRELQPFTDCTWIQLADKVDLLGRKVLFPAQPGSGFFDAPYKVVE